MLPKFKNETLTAIIIIILLAMQFVLTLTGHRQIETDLLQAVAVQTDKCPTQTVFPPR